MIGFRVRARPIDGEDFILEHYEAKSDAEQFFKELQSPEDNILESTPYQSVVISFEEFVNGQWTVASKKLVGLR
jgi:hypothetical protein